MRIYKNHGTTFELVQLIKKILLKVPRNIITIVAVDDWMAINPMYIAINMIEDILLNGGSRVYITV